MKRVRILGWLLSLTALVGLALALVVSYLASEQASRAKSLEAAIRAGDVGVLGQLLDRGEPVNGHPSDLAHPPPLVAAIVAGKPEAVRLFLDRGADVNRGSSWGRPLEIAAAGGAASIVGLLLERGAIVNDEPGRAGNGSRALWSAVDGGEAPLVKLLLRHGANPNTRLSGPGNALALARLHRNRAIIRLLEEAGAVESRRRR